MNSTLPSRALFGPLELPGNKPHNGGRVAFGLYDVSNLHVDGEIADADSPRAKISKGNELFHADSSFNDLPSKWSMLRGVIVPPERGETETIDMRAVYDALPQATKDRIAGLGRSTTTSTAAARPARRSTRAAIPSPLHARRASAGAPSASGRRRCSSARTPSGSSAWTRPRARR
jgi:alpha-ketoglutarate-dependent taurine dioxygenase